MRRELKRIGVAGQIVVLVAVSLVAATTQSQERTEDFDLERVTGDRFSLQFESILASLPNDEGDGYPGIAPEPTAHKGNTNTHFGAGALLNNTSGILNNAIGWRALYRNRSGSFNSGTGAYALTQNTTGSNNTGTGSNALYYNTTGSNNTAFGAAALAYNTSAGKSTAVGSGALLFNTGGKNTAFGWTALQYNTAGIENTAIGTEALRFNSTGRFNTAISPKALLNNNGDQNVAIGLLAGSFNVTGNRNIFIGSQAGANNDFVSANNKLVIHGNASTSPLILGDFAARTLFINGEVGATSTTLTSDARFKRDIQPIRNALGSVLRLEGRTFHWRTDEFTERGFREGPELGLIAQEVEEVLPQLVKEDYEGYKGIEYSKLTAVLVEAIKEQQKQIGEQQKQIAALLSRVAALEVEPLTTSGL